MLISIYEHTQPAHAYHKRLQKIEEKQWLIWHLAQGLYIALALYIWSTFSFVNLYEKCCKVHMSQAVVVW